MYEDVGRNYVVYRDKQTGEVFQCHRVTWANWRAETKQHLTMLVNNVTQTEARRFCQLTRED
jgi:hypothetical protein